MPTPDPDRHEIEERINQTLKNINSLIKELDAFWGILIEKEKTEGEANRRIWNELRKEDEREKEPETNPLGDVQAN